MNEMKNQHGYVLADVILGTILVSVALVVIISLFPQITRVVSSSEDYTSATLLAQGEMERLIYDTYDLSELPHIENITMSQNGIAYQITRNVTISPDDNRVLIVLVRVEWTTDQRHQVELVTFKVQVPGNELPREGNL